MRPGFLIRRFSQYYGQSSKYDMSADGAQVSHSTCSGIEDSAAFIADHVPDRDGPILDIGTATGDFLVALREVGFTSLHGVDPSPDAARKALESHGLDVTPGTRVSRRRHGIPFSAS